MKKTIIMLATIISVLIFNSCSSEDDSVNNSNIESIGTLGTGTILGTESTTGNNTETEWECGTHNGNTLYTGPEGGCYYYNSNGNKTYVEREECDC